ncbi:hypothetical protein [Sediminispirochaeta bajacaliforniensis]|uniref:hypothetical protein n=1 Tax=Sediminispirochaeta bajacaliforniensis TaxID=148 RepID=UPI000368E944|nr:hypothetical protein [Sediminispirochaeta bajacaliforniensis]
MSHQRRTLHICMLFFCVVLRVSAADEVPLPSEEVPATLFASIPEEDIDLYVSGTWQAEVSAGFALTWSTLSPVMQTTTISDIDSGFRFDQYPDIIISLWIRDRWFFDLSFKEGNDVNSIVAGYQGKEGELVQEVRVGNIDIGSFESSFFTLPEAGIDSLGLWARLTPEHSEHSFALRYDPAAYQRVTFRGMNEVKQEQFDLDDYSTNRVFVLPDDDVEDVVLYIQDEDGAFQEAGTDDAVVDTENGIVYLKEAPTGRVAVYYKKGGKEVGDSGLGTDALCGINADGLFDPKATPVDFSFSGTYTGLGITLSEFRYDEQIDGHDVLLLYRPGLWSPFLHRGIYELSTTPQENELYAALMSGSDEYDGMTLEAEQLSYGEEDFGKLIRIVDEDRELSDMRSLYRRYPLARAIIEAGYNSDIYGPKRGISGDAAPWLLQIEHLSEVSAFQLEEGVLGDSVSVTKNGKEQSRFTVDYDTGVLTPLFTVNDDDLIVVTYRTRSGGDLGDLIFATQNSFTLTDRLSLGLDAGFRWNIAGQSYTTESDQAPGFIAAGTSLFYDNKDEEDYALSFSVEAGLSLNNPDTTGFFRLLGMNDAGVDVPISNKRLFPAAADDANSSPSFPENDRGKLFYYDFYSYPTVGSAVLKRYDWSVPSDQRYPYDEDEGEDRVGPSIAATGSETDGNALVFTYELDAGEWVGGRIPLSTGGNALDLSSATRIDLLVRPRQDISDLNIYLRVGDLIEDLDGDGLLDEESGSLSSGFSFDPDGIDRPVGGDNGKTDSEDLNGDGELSWTSGEDDDLVWKSQALDVDGTSNSWQRISIDLSAAERAKLQSVTAMDIMIVNEGSVDDTTGTILVADPIFVGTSFSVNPDDSTSQTVTASEALETRAGASSASTSLAEAFPDETDIFTDGETQRCALFTWDAGTAGGTWSASTLTPTADLGNYQALQFFLRTPDPAPDNITVSLSSTEGKGVTATFVPIESDAWQLITINLDKKRIKSSEGTISDQEVSVNNRDAAVSYFKMEVETSSEDTSGELWLDELHLTDALMSLESTVKSSVAYHKQGTYFSLKGKPVLSEFDFASESTWNGDYGTAAGSDSTHSFYSSSALSSALFNGNVYGDFAFSAEAYEFLPSFTAGYAMPVASGRIKAAEEYAEDHAAEGITFSHSAEITFAPWIANPERILSLESSFSKPKTKVKQQWAIGMGAGRNETHNAFSLSLSNALTGSDEEEHETFSERMSESTEGLLLPQMDQVTRRNSKLDLMQMFPLPLGFLTVEADGSTTARSSSSKRLDADHLLSTTWDLPMEKKRNLRFRLYHELEAKVSIEDITSTPSTPLHSLILDAKGFSTGIGSIYALLSSDPLSVFGTGPFTGEEEKLLTASYTPAASCSFSRNPGSALSDLIVPATFDITRSTTYEKSYDEIGRSGVTSISWTSSAINLFGRLGSYPLADWYRTDAFASSARFDIEDSGALDALHVASFLLQINEKYSLKGENDFSASFDDGATLDTLKNETTLTLISRKGEPRRLPIPHYLRGDSPVRLIHELSFGNDLLFDNEENEQDLTLSLSHETTLDLSSRGEINAHLTGLFMREAYASGSDSVTYYTIGFEAGLGFTLSF